MFKSASPWHFSYNSPDGLRYYLCLCPKMILYFIFELFINVVILHILPCAYIFQSILFFMIYMFITCDWGSVNLIVVCLLICCMATKQFVHSTTDGHFDCFEIWASTKMPLYSWHLFWCTCVWISLEYLPLSRIVRSWICISSDLIHKAKWFSKGVVVIYTSTSSVSRNFLFHSLASIY